MRLDHIAFRVKDRDGAVDFYKKFYGYKEQAEFDITLDDGTTATCMSLEPPEKSLPGVPFDCTSYIPVGPMVPQERVLYHMAPEIFISAGPKDSLIQRWVDKYGGGIGGVHHFAYQVESVEERMQHWVKEGLSFTTEKPLTCEQLTQVFSQPNPYVNTIFEFIERKGQRGFCAENVGKLMSSTAHTVGKP